MALRSGYKGFKKLLGLKMIRPGTLEVDDTVLANTFFPRSEQAVLGAKNLLPNKLTNGTTVGVTLTVSDDGSVDVNTESSATELFSTEIGTITNFVIGKTYKISGCPSGGGDSTYDILVVCRNSGGSVLTTAKDIGNGAEITVPSNTAKVIAYLRVTANATVSHKVFYPMISLDGGEYVPYSMTNRELTEIKTGTVSEYTNSYASFNTSSAFLVSRAGVKQLYMFVTISTVVSSDDWIQIATLSEAPTKAITGINVPWDSALGSARSFVYQIDTSGKVYIRAKAAISSIISETFI